MNAATFGFSREFWSKLPQTAQEMYGVIRPLRTATYAVDHHLDGLQRALDHYREDAEKAGATFDLNPDFQRGHVWTEKKQIAYVEAILRGTAPKVFRFNSPVFDSAQRAAKNKGDINPNDFVCVDGLQRITAILRFMDGAFPVFGRWHRKDLEDTPFSVERMNYSVRFEIFAIKNRAELLQFYLDINAGGVVHSEAELARVRALLESEQR